MTAHGSHSAPESGSATPQQEPPPGTPHLEPALGTRHPAHRTLTVLMVAGAYHPEISSGGLQCESMARLMKGRAEVRVLTTAVDPTLPRREVVDGIPVTRIHIDVTSMRSRIGAGCRMLSELGRLVGASDVVHIHGCSAKNVLVIFMARLFGRPVVLSLHTAGYDEPDAVRRSGWLPWWAFRAADRCLSVSPLLVTAYLAAGLPPERIRQVPNGIDTARFTPASAADRLALRGTLALASDRPIVLFVGLFTRDKQPTVLYDAWLRARAETGLDTTLVFVGATRSAYFEIEEEMADRIRASAAARGLADRVVFVGTTHAVEDYLRAADVFVLPSRREGLPVALLEAMAYGKPIVASRVGGIPDVLADGTEGMLVAPGDVAALAGAVTTLVGDPERARALGRAAKERVAELGPDTIARRLDLVYQEVMRRG